MERRASRPGAAVLAAFLAAIIAKCLLFDFVIVNGRSMLPAIRPGRVLLVNRLAYGLRLPGTDTYLVRWRLPREGDVVIFITPEGSTAVKRCGVVALKDGAVIGATPPLVATPLPMAMPSERASPAWTFFARGDNDLESYDSRSYGPVPADRIVGKVVGIK